MATIGWRTKGALVLFGCVVGLALVEVGTRVLVAVNGHVPQVVSDRRLGWALKPGMRDQMRVDSHGRFTISTDAEGHRLTRSEGVAPTDGRVIVLVGDSLVQGLGVNDAETFGWLLASRMGCRVVNLGVLAYGTDQGLLALEGFFEAHSGLAVSDVVLFAAENDFLDVQCNYVTHGSLVRTKPRFAIVGGSLERGSYAPTTADRLMDISRFFWLVNNKLNDLKPPSDTAAGIPLVSACVREMRQVCKEHQARFSALAYRHLRGQEQVSDADWQRFLSSAAAEDITDAIKQPAMPNPFGYDGSHWSAEGHRRMASFLQQRLEAAQ